MCSTLYTAARLSSPNKYLSFLNHQNEKFPTSPTLSYKECGVWGSTNRAVVEVLSRHILGDHSADVMCTISTRTHVSCITVTLSELNDGCRGSFLVGGEQTKGEFLSKSRAAMKVWGGAGARWRLVTAHKHTHLRPTPILWQQPAACNEEQEQHRSEAPPFSWSLGLYIMVSFDLLPSSYLTSQIA